MAYIGVPKWLIGAKQDVTQSKEWNSFVGELHDVVEQQLRESNVANFTDLSEAEKSLLMERALSIAAEGRSYNNVIGRVSHSLDHRINEEVARELMEDFPINTKTDLVLSQAEDGCVSLLRQWPDLKYKLHVCLNRPLPEALRLVAYKLFLSDPKGRKQYIDILETSPRAAVSPQDLEITNKCKILLERKPLYDDFTSSVGSFYLLKAVLSYHHARLKTKSPLPDADYLLALPFLKAHESQIPRREPAPTSMAAQMVEEFTSFLQTRPSVALHLGTESAEREWTSFASTVGEHLLTLDETLCKNLVQAHSPDKSTIIATDTTMRSLLSETIKDLCKPIIRVVFVGYVSMEALMYIWDQYIIGVDVPSFPPMMLAIITAIYLYLLRHHIKPTDTIDDVRRKVTEEGKRLRASQFQIIVNRNYYKHLYSELTKDDKAARPVLDPVQAKHPGWSQWHEEVIPPRVKPQDRRRAREERLAERERITQQKREEELQKRREIEAKRREELEHARDNALKNQKTAADEKDYFSHQLQEERRRRQEAEEEAAREIDLLKQEIEMLKRQKPSTAKTPDWGARGPSELSRYVAPAPPNSRMTLASFAGLDPGPAPRTYVPGRERSPAGQTPAPLSEPAPESRLNRKATREVVRDIVTKMYKSVNELHHGDSSKPSERQELDDLTKKLSNEYQQVLSKAERQTFGASLKMQDWDRRPEADKVKLRTKVKQLIEENRKKK